MTFLALLLALSPGAQATETEVGGYMRLSTRPDFQGGDGKLGFWNLQGRLLNESAWAALESRISLVDEVPDSDRHWAAIHARVEGGSVLNGDSAGGALSQMRLSQLYALVGKSSRKGLEWQLGTLNDWTGDLGLYDMRPDALFEESLGGAVHFRSAKTHWMLALGDAGYGIDPEHYNTVLSGGGRFRWQILEGLAFGLGFEGRFEPAVQGNTQAPYATPNLDFESWVRQEVVADFVAENPNQELLFPRPESRDARSWKTTGYFGFGGFERLEWNQFYVRFEQHHPESQSTETHDGVDYTIYVNDITDQRRTLLVGNEMTLRLVPQRLDAVWAILVGQHTDGDNEIAPTEFVREYASTVLRTQTYLTPTLHWLLENSFAVEHSPNGNAYRNQVDSIFQSSAGVSDHRGLEFGDSDTRYTWQGKTGLVLNPLGPGVYVRPSIRLLYGIQHSSQHAAWDGSFVDSLDQYGDFYSGRENLTNRYWHQVLALEAEAWF